MFSYIVFNKFTYPLYRRVFMWKRFLMLALSCLDFSHLHIFLHLQSLYLLEKSTTKLLMVLFCNKLCDKCIKFLEVCRRLLLPRLWCATTFVPSSQEKLNNYVTYCNLQQTACAISQFHPSLLHCNNHMALEMKSVFAL